MTCCRSPFHNGSTGCQGTWWKERETITVACSCALSCPVVVTLSRVNLLINWKWLRYPRNRSERALYLEKISPLGLATMVQLFKGWIELSNGLTIILGFQNLSTLSTTGARAVFFHLCFPVHYCSFLLKTNATYSPQLLQMCANSTASQPRRIISNVR